ADAAGRDGALPGSRPRHDGRAGTGRQPVPRTELRRLAGMSMRIAVFASGGGSNLQALIEQFNGERPRGARVALVVADRPCAALERADQAGIERSLIPVRGVDPEELALATLAALDGAAIDLVALAGYL